MGHRNALQTTANTSSYPMRHVPLPAVVTTHRKVDIIVVMLTTSLRRGTRGGAGGSGGTGSIPPLPAACLLISDTHNPACPPTSTMHNQT